MIIEVSDPEPLDLRGEILLYLQNNPNAADSLEGIVNWWLPPIYHSVDDASVEQVLEHLIAEGRIKKLTLVDGTNLYSRQF